MKVLLVGNESKVINLILLSVRLRWPEGAPLVVHSGNEGLEQVERETPDLLLVSPDFKDMSLSAFIKECRSFSNVPMIVIGQDKDPTEAVISLESGADDYVRIPCDMTELTVRIMALLRRVGLLTFDDLEKPVFSGDLVINPATYQAFMGSERILLTGTEFRLLHLLVKNRGSIVSHQTLERRLWGDEVDSSGLVKKYVQRLRQKLGDTAHDPVWIVSIRGVGYRFIGPDPKSYSEDFSAGNSYSAPDSRRITANSWPEIGQESLSRLDRIAAGGD